MLLSYFFYFSRSYLLSVIIHNRLSFLSNERNDNRKYVCHVGYCQTGFLPKRLVAPRRPGVDLSRQRHLNMAFSASMKVLHEVTASVYIQTRRRATCDEVVFLTMIQESGLSSFLRYLKSCGLDDRAKEIGVLKYKIKLQYKRLIPEPELPQGRTFAIDTDEQFKVALPLLQDKHELIGMYV